MREDLRLKVATGALLLVRRDLLPDGLAQAVPQMPAVADLHRAGQRPADCLAVGPRPVTAHDLDPGMVPQPLLRDVSGAAPDDIDAPAGPGAGEHGRVDAAAAQREVVDPQHPRHRQGGKRDLEQDTQRGVPGHSDAKRRQQRAEGRPANSRATALTWPVSRGAPLVTLQDARDLLAERLPRAAGDRAAHPAGPYLH